jgi:hypothetical protein
VTSRASVQVSLRSVLPDFGSDAYLPGRGVIFYIPSNEAETGLTYWLEIRRWDVSGR